MARRFLLLATLWVLVVVTHVHLHSVLHGTFTASFAVASPAAVAKAAVSSAVPDSPEILQKHALPTVVSIIEQEPSPPPPLAADGIALKSPSSSSTITVDAAICESRRSCLACVHVKPQKSAGVRCVWCGLLGVCRGYIKGSDFPCADALRGGGGYPGGAHCSIKHAHTDGSVRQKPVDAAALSNSKDLLQVPSLLTAADKPTTSRDETIDEVEDVERSDLYHGVTPLHFTAPAASFDAALPLGNGRLGAMVYGGSWRETIGLNEESIIGGPRMSIEEVANAMRERAAAARKMEAAMAAGDVRSAERHAGSLPFGKVRPYEFLGNIIIELTPPSCAGMISGSAARGGGLGCASRRPPTAGYRRQLDLESGVASVNFDARGTDNCHFERHVFASVSDDVLVLRVNASCAFDAAVKLERVEKRPGTASAPGGNPAVLVGSLVSCQGNMATPKRLSLAADRSLCLRGASSGAGTAFAAVLSVSSVAPTEVRPIVDSDGKLVMRGLRDATLLLAAATDFAQRADPHSPPGGSSHPHPPIVSRCVEALTAAMASGWAQLYERHVAAHAARFGRVRLRLGRPASQRASTAPLDVAPPTDTRLKISRQAHVEDLGLVEQLVGLGR